MTSCLWSSVCIWNVSHQTPLTLLNNKFGAFKRQYFRQRHSCFHRIFSRRVNIDLSHICYPIVCQCRKAWFWWTADVSGERGCKWTAARTDCCYFSASQTAWSPPNEHYELFQIWGPTISHSKAFSVFFHTGRQILVHCLLQRLRLSLSFLVFFEWLIIILLT